MAEGKKTFIFYSDWINMVKEMPNTDAGELLKHILAYVNDENPETENILVRMAFGHMKPLLKEDLIKWDSIRKKRKKAGSKGGKANAKQKEANAKQLEAVNVNVNGNVNDSVINKPHIVPLLSEFLDYAKSKLNNQYPALKNSLTLKYEAWVAGGWKTGGDKPREIKNWKTTLLNTIPHLKKDDNNTNEYFVPIG